MNHAALGTKVTFELDPASGLPQLPAVIHDVRVLLESLGYLGVVLLDLSELNRIEVEFGRRVYNEVLRDMARDLGELARTVTGFDDFLCVRAPYGEEFILFLEGPRGTELSPHALEDVVEHLWLALQPRLSERVRPYGVGADARLGYSLALSNSSMQSERLIYRSIDEAKQMAAFHERRMTNRAREMIRDILLKGRVNILFQPIVDLDGDRVQGYEALARGPHASAMHQPRDLFNLARSANLLGELWMSCIDLTMSRIDACPPGKSLFINVTPSLLHDDYVEGCLQRAEERGISPDRFVLELSEQIAVRNYELLHRKLQGARGRGVRLAIDDLGTGYSNLSQIMRLHPDYLKVDMSLVRNVHQESAKQALIESLLRVSESLGSEVIAEGVESSEERDTLCTLGVELGQGFFFARPEEGFWLPEVS